MAALLLAAILVVLVVCVVTHFAILRVAERRVAVGLVQEGGEAEVSIDALPAVRLLWRSGDRIEVRGSGLLIGMSSEGGGLGTLDGFTEVEIELRELCTGPFEVSWFRLARRGEAPYVMEAVATTSGGSLVDYGSERLGAPAAPLLTLLARGAPLGQRRLPISIEVELASEGGLLRVAAGGGTIAGYPAGPIAGMIAAAVARRLEIVH